MKTFFATLALAALLCAGAVAQEAARTAGARGSDAEVLKRGEALGDSPLVKFADVLREPRKFEGKTVRIEGVVSRVCKKEGCWMEIAPEAESAEAVRVTFDHKFSVPRDSDRMKFRAEGRFAVKTLSKEHVEHLVKDDGAKIKTNPDGTANEVTFLATGVELWK